jgi:hypothetical protein
MVIIALGVGIIRIVIIGIGGEIGIIAGGIGSSGPGRISGTPCQSEGHNQKQHHTGQPDHHFTSLAGPSPAGANTSSKFPSLGPETVYGSP